MGDLLDIDDLSNIDDIDEDTSPVDDEETEVDDELDETTTVIKSVSQHQKKITSKEEIYQQLYQYDKNRTTNMLTKYEKARLIGFRAQMIANGAPTLVDTGDLRSPIDKAEKELIEGKLPFIIDRLLPSKNLKKPTHEYRRVSELLL